MIRTAPNGCEPGGTETLFCEALHGGKTCFPKMQKSCPHAKKVVPVFNPLPARPLQLRATGIWLRLFGGKKASFTLHAAIEKTQLITICRVVFLPALLERVGLFYTDVDLNWQLATWD